MRYEKHENLCRTGPDSMEINSEETNPNPGKRISLPEVFQPVPFLLGDGSESGKVAFKTFSRDVFFAEAHFCETREK